MKTVYYIEPLAPEMMKLLGGTKTKITKKKMMKTCLISKLQM